MRPSVFLTIHSFSLISFTDLVQPVHRINQTDRQSVNQSVTRKLWVIRSLVALVVALLAAVTITTKHSSSNWFFSVRVCVCVCVCAIDRVHSSQMPTTSAAAALHFANLYNDLCVCIYVCAPFSLSLCMLCIDDWSVIGESNRYFKYKLVMQPKECSKDRPHYSDQS